MILRLEVLDDESGTEIHDLLAWLRADDEVDSRRLVPVTNPAVPGDMSGGGILAAVETAVAGKEVLVAVIGAAGGWLSARAASRRTRIRIRCGDRMAEIDTARLKDADEIAARIHREWRDMA